MKHMVIGYTNGQVQEFPDVISYEVKDGCFDILSQTGHGLFPLQNVNYLIEKIKPVATAPSPMNSAEIKA